MKDNRKIPQGWQAFDAGTGKLFIRPGQPDWIVFSHRAAEKLEHPGPEGERLRLLMDGGETVPYRGRSRELALEGLRECWFHLTNRCNLACGHCLFRSSPARKESIDRDLLARAIGEAAGLGCNVFYFTGGEPLVYEDFPGIIARVLEKEKAHAVVLTNGILIPEFLGHAEDLDPGRLHFQISIDGREENHDRIRGKGSFARAVEGMKRLAEAKIAATMSVAVNRENFRDLSALVELAAGLGCTNVHLLWHFVRGNGSDAQFVPPEEILPELVRAQEKAEETGVSIDNVESLRAQVFSPAGTRYDLANSGWESLAVGPDGTVYPSPALVDVPELACGNIADGMEKVWRHSPVLEKVRAASLADDPETAEDPWRFLIGGGDIDHSYVAGGRLVGADPYLPLYRGLALWLIGRAAAAAARRAPEDADVLLRMGELRANCPDGGRSVSLTHCNCVVSLAADQGRAEIREFYGQAARDPNEDIVNPFAPAADGTGFIPESAKKRSYGCGSPVEAAAPRPGETVVDLGSGSGVECFMAARAVGPEGRVVGVDMTDDMLALARESKKEVVTRLGYDNVEFVRGFLEDIPLPDAFADVVISNCVINLSPDKRATFHEIIRILKPGGRLVVSDVVSDGPVEVAIKNDEQFRGECLGGALQQFHLVAMLKDTGFTAVRLLKRFPYRKVMETEFFSLTYEAFKPAEREERTGIYRGPYAAVMLDDGTMMFNGLSTTFSAAAPVDESIFVLGPGGRVENVEMGGGCCGVSPEPQILPLAQQPLCCGGQEEPAPSCCPAPEPVAIAPIAPAAPQLKKGCMVCGGELRYATSARPAVCHYCGKEEMSNAVCGAGHFVCDACHRRDAVEAIRAFCATTRETDMIAMLKTLRSHPAIPMHGPEHHAMVPGIIVAAARNSGMDIPGDAVDTAISRGSEVPGGACGFRGICGAATGAGIAFAVLLEATPVAATARQKAQAATARILAKIAGIPAGRCCQRESWTALRETAELSEEILGTRLKAGEDLVCNQYRDNRECIGAGCSLFPVKGS